MAAEIIPMQLKNDNGIGAARPLCSIGRTRVDKGAVDGTAETQPADAAAVKSDDGVEQT
jgi:hypothetical protein